MGEHSLESLVELVRQLRAPDGCPWDREQTHASITGFLIEEAYEVVHAIKEENSEALKDELGDLLFHVAFHVQLAREAGSFEIEDVLESIHEKVIRRHPHVFGSGDATEIGEVKLKWEELKAKEAPPKKSRTNSFPALVEARKLIEKSSNLGEIDLVSQHSLPQDVDRAVKNYVSQCSEREVGELLFKIVGLARSRGIEAEIALKEANHSARHALEEKSSDSS